MKSVLKTVLCASIIVTAAAGITLMSLALVDGTWLNNALDDLRGNIQDLTNDIDNGIGNNMWSQFESEIGAKEVFTYKTSYNGVCYFRCESYGDYSVSGQSFSKNVPTYQTNDLSYDPLAYYYDKAVENGKNAYTIEVNVSSPFKRDIDINYSNQYMDTATNDLYTSSQSGAKKAYSYTTSFIPDYSYKEAMEVSYQDPIETKEEEEYRDFVYDTYLSIPTSLKDQLVPYMQKNGLWDCENPIDTIKDFFVGGNFTYSKDVEACPSGQDVIMYFLNETKAGICSNFASSYTMMMRALGIPARYTVGFMSGGKANEEITVTTEALHAWCEVYINGCGWYRVDATAPIGGGTNSDEEDKSKDPSERNALKGEIGYLTDYTNTTRLLSYETSLNTGQAIYFRYKSFGDYDWQNQTFLEAEPYNGSYSMYHPLSLPYDKANDNYEKSYAVSMDYLASEELLGTALTPVYSAYPSSYASDTYLPYDIVTSTNFSFIPNYYSGVSQSQSFTNTSEAEYELAYQTYVKENYTTLDTSVKEKLVSFLESNNLSDSEDPITTIHDFLYKDGGYTVTNSAINYYDGFDIVYDFLTNKKRGNSSLFASSFVLLLRALDIPARYTVGYKATPHNGTGYVSTSNVLSYAEVYFDGVGWLSIDPCELYLSSLNQDTVTLDGEVGRADYSNNQSVILTYNSSDYGGEVYFRNASYGDYNSTLSCFLAPSQIYSFEKDTYNPLSYTYLSIENSGLYDEEITSLSMTMTTAVDNLLLPSYSNLGSLTNEGDVSISLGNLTGLAMQTSFLSSVDRTSLQYEESKDQALIDQREEYEDFLSDKYLDVPTSIKSELDKYIQKNYLEGATIEELNNFFVDHFYSDPTYKLNNVAGGDNILAFLSMEEESTTGLIRGNSSLLASSYVLIARELGYHTRFVNGFYKDSTSITSTNYVTAQDYRCWAEVYIDNVGWIRMDPTKEVEEPAREITVSYSTPDVYYDGKEHGIEELVVPTISGELKSGHSISTTLTSDTGFDTVLHANEDMEITMSVKIIDTYGNDVSNEYNLHFVRSSTVTACIKPRPITIVTNSFSYEYEEGVAQGPGPESHNESALWYLDTENGQSIAQGDELFVDENGFTSAIEEGTTLNYLDASYVSIMNEEGEDLLYDYHDYQLSFVYGEITVA